MPRHSRKDKRILLRINKQETDVVFKRQTEDVADPFVNIYSEHGLITPPYSMSLLYKIYEENDVLWECVDAMENNVAGFGYQMEFLGDDITEKDSPKAMSQLKLATDFFDRVNETQSYTSLCKVVRRDFEITGNSAIEILRNKFGDITMLYHVPMSRLRMTAVKKATTIEVSLNRNGKPITLKVKKRFRKFAQTLTTTGKQVRWFKEFGDPRIMDATTGEYMKKGEKPKIPASEILWRKNQFGDMAYGLPRWIGTILDAIGRRQAGFINYDLFENQGIPPMAIMVSGGVLTDETLEDIENLIRSARGVEKWNRILIIEATPEGMGLEDKGNAKIELKNLSEFRKEDLMFGQYIIATARHIRESFRLPVLYVGGGENQLTFACYSRDTETLTENGWKLYNDVQEGERIATYNAKKGKLEYQIPKALHVYNYNGRLYHFENRCVDSLVTINHDMLISESRVDKWFKIQAQNIEYHRFKIRTSPENPADELNNIEKYEIPEIMYANFHLFLQMIGYVVADGSIDRSPNNRIRFGFKREDKIKFVTQNINAISELFEKSHINTRKYYQNSEYKYTSLTIVGKELHDWCQENLLTKNREKVLPTWTLGLNPQQTKILLDSLMACDGTQQTENFRVYCTTSKLLADQVQILAFRLGHRASIHYIGNLKGNRKGAYFVNIADTKNTAMLEKNNDVSQIPYKGKVFCFEVKNGLFVTRRNGKIAIHGNSAKAAETVAEMQVFNPERREENEMVNLLFLQDEFNIDLWKFKLKGPEIVGGAEMNRGIDIFSRTGALSVNQTIKLANRVFGTTISEFKNKEWANYPLPIVTELLKSGRLKGLENIAEKVNLPQAQKQDRESATRQTIEAVEKLSQFANEEKEDYLKLLQIQNLMSPIDPKLLEGQKDL